jgi:hypothetical protein
MTIPQCSGAEGGSGMIIPKSLRVVFGNPKHYGSTKSVAVALTAEQQKALATDEKFVNMYFDEVTITGKETIQ